MAQDPKVTDARPSMTGMGICVIHRKTLRILRRLEKQFWRSLQLDMVSIADSAILLEYELERISSANELLQFLQPAWMFLLFFVAGLNWISGNIPLLHFVGKLLPSFFTYCFMQFGKAKFRTSDNAYRLHGIAMQVWIVSVNMILRTVFANTFATLIEYRSFYMITIGIAYYVGCLGYVPDREFYRMICPIIGISWSVFHINAGGGLNMPACISGCALVVIMTFGRLKVEALQRHAFLMSRELKVVCSSLEEVMSAQKSVLSTFFDASCVCDTEGHITLATPHMMDLLTCCEGMLVGKRFVSLVPLEEQKRVGDFLESTWQSGVAKTAMIQARLLRGSGAAQATGTRPSGSDTFEARIYCVRLAGARVATRSMQLWAHSGLFIGLQEVGVGVQGPLAGTAASENVEKSEGLEACGARGTDCGDHQIVFDAGSPEYEMISCSTLLLCAGLSQAPCDLLGGLIHGRAASVFDQWVYDEERAASEARRNRSSTQLRSLLLHLPPSQGVCLAVKSAWLEFDGLEHFDAEIPVRLRLSGLSVKQHLTQESSINTDVEGGTSEHRNQAAVEGEEVTAFLTTLSSAHDSMLLPDDSISLL